MNVVPNKRSNKHFIRCDIFPCVTHFN